MEELLHSLRNVKFAFDEIHVGKCFESFEQAFNEAKQGKLKLDCANFVSLLVCELFGESSHKDKIFECKTGIQLHNYTKINEILYLCLLDIKVNTLDLSSHGQWIVKPFHFDERWIGLTFSGVEAKTMAEWLQCGSEMIFEALRRNEDDDVVRTAALFSGEWAARRIIAEQPCVTGWTCLRPPLRTRVRTRQYLKQEIARVEEAIKKRKRND